MDGVFGKVPRGLLSDSLCVCPAGILPGEEEGPTSQSFQDVFNTQVEEEKENGALDGVELSVDNLIEGQEVNCSADVQTFKTNVIVDVSLSLEELDQQQKAAVESVSKLGFQEIHPACRSDENLNCVCFFLQTFKDSFNDLSFGLCDNLFRSVVNVNLDSQGAGSILSRRQLQNLDPFVNGTHANATHINGTYANGTVANETNTDRNTVFTVVGQCRGCQLTDAGNFNLFDDAFRRRRRQLRVSDSSRSPLQRKLQNELGLCVCPINVEPGEENMGPSAEEFKDVFNQKLQEEQENGALAGVNVTVENVLEGQIVDCEPTEQEFKSEIFSDLQVNLTSLTPEEVTVLEEGTCSPLLTPVLIMCGSNACFCSFH